MAAPDVMARQQVFFNRKFRMTSSGESCFDRRLRRYAAYGGQAMQTRSVNGESDYQTDHETDGRMASCFRRR